MKNRHKSSNRSPSRSVRSSTGTGGNPLPSQTLMSLSWMATTPQAMRQASRSLEDQLRGSLPAVTLTSFAGWELCWTVWETEEGIYGVTFHVEPHPGMPF